MAEEQEVEFNNDGLLDALAALREEETPTTETNFVNALIKATFLVPVLLDGEPEITEDGMVQIPEDTEMKILTWENTETKLPVFPVFTDMGKLDEIEFPDPEQTHLWPIPLMHFVQMFKEDTNLSALFLNPYTGMELTRFNLMLVDKVAQLADGKEVTHAIIQAAKAELEAAAQPGSNATEQVEVDGESEMEISQPQDVPVALQYELMGVADDHPGDITKMWLLWLSNEEQNINNFFLLVEGPNEAAFDDLFPVLADAFKKTLPEDQQTVTIMPRASLGELDLSDFKTLYDR
ncbi:MAG: SseB family protein [Lactobacillaceae bacterium]|jgi:hypothetical protein|nr:SseB family protein [Lactobacillaceae bacterium]